MDAQQTHPERATSEGEVQEPEAPPQTPASPLLGQEPSLIRAIMDTTGALVVVLDLQGRIVHFNRACESLTGYTAGEMAGKHVWDLLLVPEEIDAVRAVFEDLRAGRFPKQFENYWLTKDNQRRSIAWSKTALVDSSGAVRFVIGTGIDITDRKRAEEALLEREQRLRAILDSAVDAIVTINAQGVIDTFNSAAEQMFGFRVNEVIGRNVNVLMPSPYREEHNAYLARYHQTGEARIIGLGREILGQRRDGSVFPLEITVTEIDHRRLFVAMLRDISERKRKEEQLLQKERLAAIGEAMAGLAHEGRNALQRSQANLQRLAWRVEDQPEATELIAGIQDAQDHLHALYEEVREFAAPLRVQLDRCHLGEALAKTWEKLHPQHEDREVRFRQHHAVALDLYCFVDPFALERVFRNILENALSACSDPVEIESEFSETEVHDYPALRIALRDNGPGLGAEQRERIFDSFYTTKTRGTGLGMAIAKRIVEAHGGEIAVGPGLDQGAEILITLPRRPA